MKSVHTAAALLLLTLATAASAEKARRTPAPDALPRAQSALDAGRPAEALELLTPVIERQPDHAAARLARSTALFMLGETDEGRRELFRALKLDPSLRQGWLNRAALEMAEDRPQDALASLLKARELDPEAADNDLNIGAARLLLGQLDQAAADFERYLATHSEEPQAYYLVATNYAMAGLAAFSLHHLQQAIELDERMRRRARVDPNFSALAEDPRYQEVLVTDVFRPAPDAHRASRSYETPYAGGEGVLLEATLDAVRTLGEPIETAVEVAPGWALIWGEMRVKVSDASPPQGQVELSAARDRFTAAEWERRSKRLLDSILVHAERIRGARARSLTPPAPPGS